MSLFSNNPLMNRFWREGIELQPRWFRLFENLGIKFDYESEEFGEAPLSFEFLQVFNRYSESHRFHHTPKHILDCLREFEGVEKLAESSLAVSSALWFHDVIYNPRANDNEEKSEQYARRTLKRLKLPELFIQKVGNFVLITKHSIEPATIDEALAVDIDLSIFGKPEEIFNDYDQNIRKEYLWIPEDHYRKGRKQVLKNFIDRPHIYQTDFFRQKYEERARTNLEKAIRALEKT